MSTTCREARRILDRSVHADADEPSLLALEEHLGGCEGCRGERARLLLLASLRRAPEPTLDEAAHQRILRQMRLQAAAPKERRWSRSPWMLLRRPLVLLALPLLVVAALQLRRGPPAAPSSETEEHRSPVVLADRTELAMKEPGQLEYAGSTVRYTAGTRLVVHGGARRLELLSGSLDVDVVPGHGRYRVETPRFAVEVLGTRFVVKPDAVETMRGLVRVESLGGATFSLVHAGERWELPSLPAAAPMPELPAPPPRRVAKPAPLPANHPPAAAPVPAAEPPVPDLETLLEQARASIGRRDFAAADDALAQVNRFASSDGQRARAAFLGADLLRLRGHGAAAVDAYRGAIARFPKEPVAEQGAFLVGELLLEQGRAAEARAALEAYLAAHPDGAFAAEARTLLAPSGE